MHWHEWGHSCCGEPVLRCPVNRDKLETAELDPVMSESGLLMDSDRTCPPRLLNCSRTFGAVQTKLAVGLALGVGLLGWVGWGVSRASQQSVSVYWLTDANSDIHYVIEERTVRGFSDDRAIAAGLNILIDGHPQDQLLSAVPTNTELLGARQEGDEIYLDFSEEFASGGGASSLLGRVTQVLYTATSSAPAAKVWIAVEGEPVEVLSGEGLLVEQPLTRASFPPNFKDYIASPQQLEQDLESAPDPNAEHNTGSSLTSESDLHINSDTDPVDRLQDPDGLDGVI